MTLSVIQKDLIVGSLLGDGNLQTGSRGQTWRYRALQKAEHLEYLMYKYNLLQNYCGTGLIFADVPDERTGKVYKRAYFNTLVNKSFRYYGNIFYTFDKKVNKFVKKVPKKIEKILTPRAVAIWYQDDGACKWKGHSNAMRICTESFCLEDLMRLKSAMKNLFDIHVIVTSENRIYIPEGSSGAFRRLISPYLVDCMKYKVSDGSRGSLG